MYAINKFLKADEDMKKTKSSLPESLELEQKDGTSQLYLPIVIQENHFPTPPAKLQERRILYRANGTAMISGSSQVGFPYGGRPTQKSTGQSPLPDSKGLSPTPTGRK